MSIPFWLVRSSTRGIGPVWPIGLKRTKAKAPHRPELAIVAVACLVAQESRE